MKVTKSNILYFPRNRTSYMHLWCCLSKSVKSKSKLWRVHSEKSWRKLVFPICRLLASNLWLLFCFTSNFCQISRTFHFKVLGMSYLPNFWCYELPKLLRICIFPDIRELFGKNLSNLNFKQKASSRLFSNEIVAKCAVRCRMRRFKPTLTCTMHCTSC